jgi:hypothetical protein
MHIQQVKLLNFLLPIYKKLDFVPNLKKFWYHKARYFETLYKHMRANAKN